MEEERGPGGLGPWGGCDPGVRLSGAFLLRWDPLPFPEVDFLQPGFCHSFWPLQGDPS